MSDMLDRIVKPCPWTMVIVRKERWNLWVCKKRDEIWRSTLSSSGPPANLDWEREAARVKSAGLLPWRLKQHRLIRINVKIKFIVNNYNYNYLSHVLFHLLNILIHTKNIYSLLLLSGSIDFILHRTSLCVWYIFNGTIYSSIGILIHSIMHEYMVTNITGGIFI
jgi:hypothetical protein